MGRSGFLCTSDKVVLHFARVQVRPFLEQAAAADQVLRAVSARLRFWHVHLFTA